MKTYPNRLTEEQKARVKYLFDINMTIKEISQMTDISRRSVGRILIEAGIKGTPVKEGKEVLAMLKAHKVSVEDLHKLLVFKPGINEARQFIVNLDDDTYSKLLAEVIHLREAKRFNSSVTNAMLQLTNKAKRNGQS